jgi:hypothetical protein
VTAWWAAEGLLTPMEKEDSDPLSRLQSVYDTVAVDMKDSCVKCRGWFCTTLEMETTCDLIWKSSLIYASWQAL